MSPIRVLLVDDHPVLRAGMRNLLVKAADIEVIGEASNGEDALQMVKRFSPDVILLDLEMPGMPGIEVAQELLKEEGNIRILVLSAHNDRQYIQGLLASGASGYLVKDEAPDAIVEAVRGVARGEQGWISRQVTAMIASWSQEESKPGPGLTDREVQVLQQVVAGKTNQEIGVILGISDKTVEKHLEGIFQKLGVASRTEAAVWATREEMNENNGH